MSANDEEPIQDYNLSGNSMEYTKRSKSLHSKNYLDRKSKYIKRTKSMMGHGTVRLKAGERIDIDEFANEMLDEDLIDGNTSMPMETLKSTATNLSVKRKIRKRYLDANVGKEFDLTNQLAQSKEIARRAFQRNLAELKYHLSLWSKDFKKIEGTFGTSVSSYFELLKWLLLWLNIPTFILIFGLLVIPQMLYRFFQSDARGYVNEIPFTGKEILTGGDWLRNTELYYGSYINDSVSFIGSFKYNIPNAYFSVIASSYGLMLLILLFKLTSSYKTNVLEAGDVLRFYYVNKIMAGWDHYITNESSASLKHSSIQNELKEFLTQLHVQTSEKPFKTKCGLFFLRIFTYTVALTIICCATYLVHYIIKNDSLDTDMAFISDLALPITLTAINYVIPFLFSLISRLENYSNPRIEQNMTLLRTMILTYATTGVAFFYWLTKIECNHEVQILPSTTADTTPQTNSITTKDCNVCWENILGEKLYKFVIMDFIFAIIMTFFSEILVKLISKVCCKKVAPPEFNIARNTLYLIYSQMLIMISFYFSPIMPLISILKLIIIFYFKKNSLLICCKPSKKPWRAGQINTTFILILLVSFVLSFLVFGYSCFFISPSGICGPYIIDVNPYSSISVIFDGWRSEYSWIAYGIKIMTTSEFISCVLSALVIVIYYMRLTSGGLNKMIDLLNHQLSVGADEKKILLAMLPQSSSDAISIDPDRSVLNQSEASLPSNIPSRHIAERPLSLAAVGNFEHGYDHHNKGYADRSLEPVQSPYIVSDNTSGEGYPNLHGNPQHYNMYP